MSVLGKTLLSVEVTETDKNREYWLSRPWVSGDQKALAGSSDVLIVPWEDFREDVEATFPAGTVDVFHAIKAAVGSAAVAIDELKYSEIALHADEQRLPTLILSSLILPVVVGVLVAQINHATSEPASQVSARIVVEGPQGKCISINYKGPSERFAETALHEADRCFPASNHHKAEKAKKKHGHRAKRK